VRERETRGIREKDSGDTRKIREIEERCAIIEKDLQTG
jgi:hypothetical protein